MKMIIFSPFWNNVHWWIVHSGTCIRTVNGDILISCWPYQTSCTAWARMQRYFYPVIQGLKYDKCPLLILCDRVSGCMCQYKSLLHLHRLTVAPVMALFSDANSLEFFNILLNLRPLGTDNLENVLAKMTATSPKIHINLWANISKSGIRVYACYIRN